MSDDALITLRQAVDLPVWGGHYDYQALWRFCRRDVLPLPTVQPGREIMTRASWVENWLEELRTWPARERIRTYSGATTGEAPGASSTDASAIGSASLEARLQLLSSASPSTSSRRRTPPPTPPSTPDQPHG